MSLISNHQYLIDYISPKYRDELVTLLKNNKIATYEDYLKECQSRGFSGFSKELWDGYKTIFYVHASNDVFKYRISQQPGGILSGRYDECEEIIQSLLTDEDRQAIDEYYESMGDDL